MTPPATGTEYIPDPAVAVAAAYTNLNSMYTAAPYPPPSDNLFINSSVHPTNFYPVGDNLYHQYRLQGVSGYYPEYHHSQAPAPYVSNGFLPYDSYAIPAKEEKWQECGKYYAPHDPTSRNSYTGYESSTGHPQVNYQLL